MKKIIIIAITLLSGIAHAAEVEWGYSGNIGPEYWGGLAAEFATCTTGQSQSPIDIDDVTKKELPDLVTAYHDTPLVVLNNGHTIEVEYHAGSFLTVDGASYELKQFHFHTPSEHNREGASYPMEVHLVHKDGAGNLAVIGIFIRVADENDALENVFENMPTTPSTVHVEGEEINALDFLPKNMKYVTYSGSLTTPPCSEGVRWIVLKKVISVSKKQYNAFKAIYDGNARPVQDLNGREVLRKD